MSGVLSSTAAAIGIIDKAVGIAKKLANDSSDLDKATLKLELVNLMNELASAKMEVITTQVLLFDAEQKNKDLTEQLKDKSKFTFRDGVWWKEDDGTAFCPKCYEVSKIQTHMKYVPGFNGLYGLVATHWSCNNCNLSVDCK